MWPDIIAKAVRPPAERKGKIYAAIGTGCHAGAAAMATQIVKAESATLEAGQSTALKTCREIALAGVEYDEITTSIAVAEKQILRMVATFHADIVPELKPKSIELRRLVTINNEYELSGMMDLETVIGEIYDWKFGHVWRTCKAQLGGYSLIRRAYEKTATPAIIGCHTARVGVKKPQPATERRVYDVTSAEKLALEIVQMIIRDMTAFQKNGNPAAFPCNPMSMMCGPKYCISYDSEWCRADLW